MKLPVASLSITLNEIPNHFAVAIELGNCKQKCAVYYARYVRRYKL